MNKLIKVILLFVVLIGFQSCDSSQKQIGENYFVRWINGPETMCIGFGTEDGNEGIVKETIYEVKWNTEYIIAKRHPLEAPGVEGINRDITEYYILKKVKFGEAKASENMFGPLIEEEFKVKRDNLGLIEDEMESMIFDDLK